MQNHAYRDAEAKISTKFAEGVPVQIYSLPQKSSLEYIAPADFHNMYPNAYRGDNVVFGQVEVVHNYDLAKHENF